MVSTPLGPLTLHNPDLKGNVDVVLLPEAMTLTPDSEGFAHVDDVSYFGFHQLLTLKLAGGETVQARTWSHANISEGDRVNIKIEAPVVAFGRDR